MRAWALVLLSLGAGCDLSVHPFAGTIVQMTIEGASVSAPGKHLELWATSRYGDVIRISGINKSKTGDSPGMRIVKAITLDDPCMIDANGNLLTTPAAYQTVVVDGQTQDPQQQANQVINRIEQVLSPADGGFAQPGPGSLLAVVPYTASTPPVLDPSTSAADRLAACKQYWTDPLAYTPNPAQFTNPLNGQVYGFVGFQTQMPPQGYDGIRIDSPDNLRGVQELFLTVENDTVDAHNRGPLYLDGIPMPAQNGGTDYVQFNLFNVQGTGISGTAALLINADQDPVMF